MTEWRIGTGSKRAEGASARTEMPTADVARPLPYALRMIAFLVAVGLVASLLHEQVYRFFLRNPPLNSLILSVLVLGIGLSFRAVLSLGPEVKWLERFRRADPTLPGEPVPPLVRPLAAMLRDPQARVGLSATGVRSVLDGVDSRLDERRETSRYLIALLIFLGLLGTFWGLLLTATSVGDTIRALGGVSSDPAEMFETLRAGLEAPLSGMGTAFSTSLFGLACSLVLGFLDLQASQAQNRFANELEGWLAGHVRLGGADPGEGAAAPAYLCALLEKTFEGFDELQRRLMRATEESSGAGAAFRMLAERWASVGDEMARRNAQAESSAEAQRETAQLLRRIAGAVESGRGGVDEATRTQLRNIEAALLRQADASARGMDRALAEIRAEIRLLARTVAVKSGGEG